MFIYPWGDMHSLNLGWFLLQFKDWVDKLQEYLQLLFHIRLSFFPSFASSPVPLLLSSGVPPLPVSAFLLLPLAALCAVFLSPGETAARGGVQRLSECPADIGGWIPDF